MFLLRKQKKKRQEGGELHGCFFPCEHASNKAERISNNVSGGGKLAYSVQAVTQEPE